MLLSREKKHKGVEMTIKNIALSVAAVSVIATAAFAGTVNNPGNVGLIGQEALSLNDANISSVFGTTTLPTTSTASQYTPTNIRATSLKNPIFKFIFTSAKDITATSTAAVFEVVDGNASNVSVSNYKMVAKNPQISGSKNEIISFNASDSSIYAYNNKKYVVADSNTTDVNGTAAIEVTVVKGSTSDVTLATELYSGDSQQLADAAPAISIAKVGPEYVGSVTQKFDARIDASNSFFTFYDRNSDGATKRADDAIFNLHQNATLPGASLGATDATIVVTFDQNLTANAYVAGGASVTQNDTNVTDALANIFNTTNAVADVNETITLTVNGSSAVKKTNFDAHAYVTSGSTNFDLIGKTSGNAGAWTIYGYNAQIPNVVGLTNIDTTMKFTNRSSLDTNIYFTLIDPDGTVATLNSVDNTELAKLPANSTGKYKASALLALVTDPAFNKNGSISVEVSIPTTPDAVYGMASFKNKTLGQFKDLPVYNSSSMSY